MVSVKHRNGFPKSLGDRLEDLHKKIELARDDSILNEEIAKDFSELKRIIELQMAFISHQWHCVLRYPEIKGIRQGRVFYIDASDYQEAIKKATQEFESDRNAVTVDLYCDGKQVWFV